MVSKSSSIQVDALLIERNGNIPNNPSLPLLLYHGAMSLGDDPVATCEATFERNSWVIAWRTNAVHPYHHYHATKHEAVAVARGSSQVQFGGDNGTVIHVSAGDVILIPAGVAHKSKSASPDFLIVGAYAEKQGKPDSRIGSIETYEEDAACVRRTDVPITDPVFGRDGPMLKHWHKALGG